MDSLVPVSPPPARLPAPMPKKDTRRKMVNPKTGRKVLMTGSIGKKLRAKAKRAPPSQAKKKVKTCHGGTCYGGICPPKSFAPSAMYAVAGKSKNNAIRPKASFHASIGDFSPKVYGGFLHVIKWDKLGRPSYKPVCRMK